MKKIYLFLTLVIFLNSLLKSQTTNDLLNLMVSNKLLTQDQADSVRAEAAIRQQETESKRKLFGVNANKSLQIGGYGQFRYQVFEESGKSDGFDVRRAYLDMKGAITPRWNFKVQADFANSPKMIDFFTEYKFKEFLNLTVGQFVIPFSLANITSNSASEIADRPQVVEALSARGKDVSGNQNGRDIGIQLSGSFIKINDLKLVEYKIGIFNGSGINTLDNNEAKDVVGRLIFHPVAGLNIGGSIYNGWTKKSNLTDTTAFGKRFRWGLEASYTYKILSVCGEFIVGEDGPYNRAGLYGQAGVYVWPKKIQIVTRYDIYDANRDKAGDIKTNYIVGANFVFNPNVKLQISYTIREEQTKSLSNNIGAAQLQISF